MSKVYFAALALLATSLVTPVNSLANSQIQLGEAVSATAATQGTTPGKGWIYTYPSPLASGKGWLDTYYLWMVPTYEITMNPQLTQNPGYAELFPAAAAEE